MKVIGRIIEIHEEMTTWRQDIQTYPELGFEENHTSDLVASKRKE